MLKPRVRPRKPSRSQTPLRWRRWGLPGGESGAALELKSDLFESALKTLKGPKQAKLRSAEVRIRIAVTLTASALRRHTDGPRPSFLAVRFRELSIAALLQNDFVMRTPKSRGSVRKTLVVSAVSSLLRNAPVMAVVSNRFLT